MESWVYFFLVHVAIFEEEKTNSLRLRISLTCLYVYVAYIKKFAKITREISSLIGPIELVAFLPL